MGRYKKKPLLCKLGLHKEAYICMYTARSKGKHKWNVTHTFCKRCGKKIKRLTYLTKSKVRRMFGE